jgi:hypothetical protein
MTVTWRIDVATTRAMGSEATMPERLALRAMARDHPGDVGRGTAQDQQQKDNDHGR